MRGGAGFVVDDALKKGDCFALALSSKSKSKSSSKSSLDSDILCPVLEASSNPYQSSLHYREPQIQPISWSYTIPCR